MNLAAQALGRRAKGVKKTMTPAALSARRKQIAAINDARRKVAAIKNAPSKKFLPSA